MWQIMSRGGPVMWPLLFCSLVSVTVVVARAIFWWREGRLRDGKLLERMLAEVGHGNWEKALSLGKGSRDFVVRVVAHGLGHREIGMENALEIAATREIDRMKRGMGILDTIITLSPLLGILGTVLGIIQSFDMLGEMGIEDPKVVTGGIAQALITTAAGLTIAIVTLLPFNYFQSRVSGAAMELEQHLNGLEIAHRKGLAARNQTATHEMRVVHLEKQA